MMPLINCEINSFSTWSEDCILISGDIDNQVPKFEITLCSSCNFINPRNVELLDKVKLGFKRTINWNKYPSKVSIPLDVSGLSCNLGIKTPLK